MRTVATILILGIVTAFQIEQETTITNFTKTQLDKFKIIRNFKTDYSVNPTEGLDSRRTEITLKAKKSHVNERSYYKTVYTRIRMCQIDFKTEAACERGKDKLLNCFGGDCQKIKRQVNQSAKVTPSMYILGKTSIVIAEIYCEHADQTWTDFTKEFAEAFADTDTEIILTGCGSLTWTTKEKIKNSPPQKR